MTYPSHPPHPMRDYLTLSRPPMTVVEIEKFARMWFERVYGLGILIEVRVDPAEGQFLVRMNFEIRGWRSWFRSSRARIAEELRDMVIHLPCHVWYDIAVFRSGTPMLQLIVARVVGFFRRLRR